MEPIGRNFGFWVLVICGFGMCFTGNGTGASIFMVGAVLFDAIKTINR
jgi:hypothetical protein